MGAFYGLGIDNAIVELSYEIIIPKSDETIQEIKWKIDKISSLKTTHIRPNFYIPKTKIFLLSLFKVKYFLKEMSNDYGRQCVESA